MEFVLRREELVIVGGRDSKGRNPLPVGAGSGFHLMAGSSIV